jgi:hypothetical protein
MRVRIKGRGAFQSGTKPKAEDARERPTKTSPQGRYTIRMLRKGEA